MTDPKSPTPLVADHALQVVDARGLKCPEPVMMFRNSLRNAPDHAVVRLIATDPSTLRDIPTMCRFMGHALIETLETDDEYQFVVSARGAS